MSELSPAALTVWSAFLDRYEWEVTTEELFAVAAALRAAADQAEDVCPARPSTEWGEGWLEGVKDVVAGFRRIAAELEAQ